MFRTTLEFKIIGYGESFLAHLGDFPSFCGSNILKFWIFCNFWAAVSHTWSFMLAQALVQLFFFSLRLSLRVFFKCNVFFQFSAPSTIFFNNIFTFQYDFLRWTVMKKKTENASEILILTRFLVHRKHSIIVGWKEGQRKKTWPLTIYFPYHELTLCANSLRIILPYISRFLRSPSHMFCDSIMKIKGMWKFECGTLFLHILRSFFFL